MIDNSTENFQGFELLKEEEMLQVRGGEDTRPRVRPIDIVPELP